MEKKLTADLNVVANSNLEVEYLNGDLNIIQKLDDEPNDVGGLTSAQLKAKFDEAGNTIKTYINDTLIPAILADDATEAAREAAEQERVTAEQGRASAEEARVAAETARVQDEQKRVSAENSRVEAEAQRAAAEQARADENTGIVAQATAQANAAAGSAESASASAQTAQSAASSAGAAASTASSAAASASGSASQASAAAASAAQSAASVAGINKTAESWAVGGTGTREGENTNNAKYWAQQAEATVGGDFATKTEAQGYVADHNQSSDAHSDIRTALNDKEAAGTAAAAITAHNTDTTAHSDIREAVSEAGKAFVITGTLTDDAETDGYTVSGVTVTEAEIQAAIAAGKVVVAKLTYSNAIQSFLYEIPLISASDGVYVFTFMQGEMRSQLSIYYGESETAVASFDVTSFALAADVAAIPRVIIYPATIGTTWTEDSTTGVKTQSVAIPGVLSTHTATVDHAYTGSGTSEDYAAFVEAENQYLNCITNGYAETYNGGIKFTIFGDANTVSIPIVVVVM